MLITEFFKDQEIFVTGASGFLGKALVEKLLRSCPGIRKIFVLIRPKKGKTPQERWQEVWQTSCFENLRATQPELGEKVVAIGGDCKEIGLAISPEDRIRIQNVTIVFHSAANVRFDDSLREAVLLNTRGTHELVKIALTLKKLKVFVHVSTTYSNPTELFVEEKVYNPPADWRSTIKLAETYDAESLEVFTSKYIQKHPNTYTFSKNLSEQIINEYRHQIPAFIFRPAIIISAIDEPAPGWIDNFNGSVGLYVTAGIGITRTHFCDPEVRPAYIPVDIVVRSMIVAAYKKGSEGLKDNFSEIPGLDEPAEVVNCSTTTILNTSSEYVSMLQLRFIKTHPFEKTVWAPTGSMTKYWPMYCVKFMTIQLLISSLADAVIRAVNKKPMLMKLQRRIFYTIKALRPFIVNEWQFGNQRFLEIEKSVPRVEYETFSFLRYESLDVEKYILGTLLGAKHFLLKDPWESTPEAKRRFKILTILDYILRIAFVLLGLRLLMYIFK